MPNLYVIAGCNGAGKTTASFTVLPEMLNCYEFINADEIARGISPLKPEKVAFEAGRIMLNQIDKHLDAKVDFAIETTLSSKHYEELILNAKKSGYEIRLVFFWLKTVDFAKERVKKRVENGGHNIPEDIIERRYKRGLFNFFHIFSSIVDSWMFVDNNDSHPIVLANCEVKNEINYTNKILFEIILTEANEYKY